MRGFRLAITLLALLQVGCSSPGSVTGASVRDANFEVVKVLSPEEIPAFARLWDDKQEVQVSFVGVGGQHFKLDVERQHSSRRWLYQTTGYASLLDISAKPVYKLRDAETFNKLIGAPQ